MAKFKKKKSKPTPGPDDFKKSPTREPTNENKEKIPETEPIESEKPETEPIESEPETKPVKSKKPDKSSESTETVAEKSEKDKKLNKLFWLRVGLAVIAGTAATFIFDDMTNMEEKRWSSIGFMIAVFFVTIIIAKGMKIQLPSSDRKKIVTQGIGSYIFIYLFVWVLVNTLVYGSTAAVGIPSPIP